MKLHAGARTCPHCRLLIVSRILEDKQAAVSREFRVSTRTVRKWLRRYRSEGPAGLEDKSSAPTVVPRRLLQPGVELNDAVMRVLHTPPVEHGLNRTSWRMGDIKAVLDKQGRIATLNSIRTVIRNAGVQWKQARVALTSKDPDCRAKLDAIKGTLANLAVDEAFFSIDELGPVAIKMRGGRSLQLRGEVRTVPQWQKSRGSFILTAALDLAQNQITYFFSYRKNTDETIRLIDVLRERYAGYRKLYVSWDSAPWHSSARLKEHLTAVNEFAVQEALPRVGILPLPTSAQFLNVIESVFSGMARAVLHNSDYPTLDDAKAAVTCYLQERNEAFLREPHRAGRTIWGKERVASAFSEVNNCKDPRWLGLR